MELVPKMGVGIECIYQAIDKLFWTTGTSDPKIAAGIVKVRRMFKKAIRQGRSERKAEAYEVRYVEALSDARTRLVDFFNILPRG